MLLVSVPHEVNLALEWAVDAEGRTLEVVEPAGSNSNPAGMAAGMAAGRGGEAGMAAGMGGEEPADNTAVGVPPR